MTPHLQNVSQISPNDSKANYSNFLNLGRVTEQQDVQVRPSRSNRGKGGAIAQLQAVSDRIRHVQRVKKPSNNALQDVPVNKMAPPEKGRQTAVTVSYFILLLTIYSNVSIPGEGSSTSPSC